jgi:hypothetical protein
LTNRTLLGIALIVAAIFGGTVGSQALLDSVDRSDVDRAVGDALVENCEEDLVFRRQYRHRAIAEQRLLGIQVQVNEALIEVVNGLRNRDQTNPELEQLGVVLDRANLRLNNLRSAIDILPLPECEELRLAIE